MRALHGSLACCKKRNRQRRKRPDARHGKKVAIRDRTYRKNLSTPHLDTRCVYCLAYLTVRLRRVSAASVYSSTKISRKEMKIDEMNIGATTSKPRPNVRPTGIVSSMASTP